MNGFQQPNAVIVTAVMMLASVATFVSADAPSGHRVALLIGNAKYDGARLPCVGESLDAVQRSLEAHGYTVQRHENLAEKQLDAAAHTFAQSVPTNGISLVYCVGFGAHVVRGTRTYNLLRPVDTEIRNESDYRSRGLNVHELLDTLNDKSGARHNLVFIDACWDSPIRPDDKSVLAGMLAFDPPAGSTVMFAAPSKSALPLPTADAPTALSAALARHVERFDTSIKQACEVIAADTGNAWFGGAIGAGIGTPSSTKVATELREGREPGEVYINSIGMAFRWCPAGSFSMGTDRTDAPATRDRGTVQVTLSKGFWIGEHEVTQREHYAATRKNPPRGFTEGPNIPYWGANEHKSVTDYCKKLTELERKAGVLPNGWAYGCPTEAEWEYACRAGSDAAFCYGDDAAQLGRYGNFADKALATANPNFQYARLESDDGVGEALAPVGNYMPNAWGIRDMHGNVAEIVADHLVDDERPGGTDPLVRVKKDGRNQIRGGAWCSLPLYCESTFRNVLAGRDKRNYVGFRIVLKKIK